MKPTTAMAQAAATARATTSWCPAEVVGGNGAIVYVIDTTRGQLSAMALDQNQPGRDAPVDLNRVFDARAPAPAARGE